MEFKRATIKAAENGYEVEICVKMEKPSRKEIAEMNSPAEATIEGDSVMDYKKYVAKTLTEAMSYIKEYEPEDKNEEG